jgi:hypothetical protein
MKAIVVYESLWGNTAAIAHAIAAGIGPGARALSTAEATDTELAGVDLVVAGAPVHAFSLPSERTRQNAIPNPAKAQKPPDLSHPPLRSWLAALPKGRGRSAAFDTRFRWTPGGATSRIVRALESAGYPQVSKAQHFIVTGGQGPLREGELERARAWGAELATVMG